MSKEGPTVKPTPSGNCSPEAFKAHAKRIFGWSSLPHRYILLLQSLREFQKKRRWWENEYGRREGKREEEKERREGEKSYFIRYQRNWQGGGREKEREGAAITPNQDASGWRNVVRQPNTSK